MIVHLLVSHADAYHIIYTKSANHGQSCAFYACTEKYNLLRTRTSESKPKALIIFPQSYEMDRQENFGFIESSKRV